MDESSWVNDCSTASILDLSGNAKNGKSCPAGKGPTTPVAGKSAAAVDLNGSNQYLDVPNPALPTGDFTYSVWINPDTAVDEMIMMSGGSTTTVDELRIHLLNSDIVVYLDGITVISTNANIISTGSWQHISVTRTGSTVTLYVNGAVQATGTSSVTLDFGACQLLIGVDADSSCGGGLGNWFDGKIDELRVYDRGLTPSEVSLLYGPIASPSPSASSKPGDLDGDKDVDIFDYNILLTNFGT